MIAATISGHLISTKRVTAGIRTRQILGQMSDATLQQFLKDGAIADREASGKAVEDAEAFKGQYEAGRSLQ